MGKVSFDINMSLDGFITAANRRPEEPLGDSGEQLHAWAFNSDVDGIESALTQMKQAAGSKEVTVMGGEHVRLETTEVIQTKEAIHLRFRVVKQEIRQTAGR